LTLSVPLPFRRTRRICHGVRVPDYITIGALDSRLGLYEAFKGFKEQREFLAALVTNLQVLLDEVIGFFDWPPLEGKLGEAAQFPQALVAGQLSIPRAADGLQKGADLVD
jgi:hypothetical protein